MGSKYTLFGTHHVILFERPSIESASRPDDVSYRPDAHLSKASSVRTTRTFRPDTHQCLEASNNSSLHLSGRNGKSSERSSKFNLIGPIFKLKTWKYLNNSTHKSQRLSLFFNWNHLLYPEITIDTPILKKSIDVSIDWITQIYI
jgi:hypothetical protein